MDFWIAGKLAWSVHVFLAHIWQGEAQETSEMGIPEWFNLSEIPYHEMQASDCLWMPLVLVEGKTISAEVRYKDSNTDQVENFSWKSVFKI